MNHKKLKIICYLSLLLTVSGAVYFGIGTNRRSTATKSRFYFGTLIEITATGQTPEKPIEAAFREIGRIEHLTGSHPDSDVSRLNQQAGNKAISVTPDTLEILKLIQTYDPLVEGAFDPTVAPLVELWGFDYQGRPHLPGPDQIQLRLPLVDRRRIKVNRAVGTVFLTKPGMKLDFGGIAKGYAIDRAYRLLRQAGIKSALINGGNSSIRIIGLRRDKQPWRIGIGHPRRTAELLGQLTLPCDYALGTSADTVNYFNKDGKRYSHLINPRNGYPARDKMLVTVTAPTAAEADLLSTACFILPLVQIKKLIVKRPNVTVIMVDSKQRIFNLNNPYFKQ